MITQLHAYLSAPRLTGTVGTLSVQATGYDALIIGCGLISFGLYIKRLFTRDTPPPIATWGLYLCIDVLSLYADYVRGTLNLQILTYTTGALVVVGILTIRRNWAWGYGDSFTLGAVLCAVLLWQTSGNPTVGFWSSMGAFWIATIPLYLGLWKREILEEPLDSWVVVTFGSVVSYLAGYPESAIALGLLQGLVLILILRNRYPNALSELWEEIR